MLYSQLLLYSHQSIDHVVILNIAHCDHSVKYKTKKKSLESDLVHYFKNKSRSSSAVVIPAIPNVSTKILATFGDKNPGKVGPR